MRISDWSSDVCSSDLLPGEFSANNGNPDFSPRPYDPADVYAIVRNRYVNAASTRIRGTDLSVHYAMDLWGGKLAVDANGGWIVNAGRHITALRSEEHTSELQSLMRVSYAGFRLK